jgi:glycine/D-amino acid oxidase-like deaminating enzyme
VTRPDVIVLGAGMVGAWTALGLAERGLRVLVVERAFAGAGSTGAAMGHLVVMDDTPAQLALCRHAVARWHAVAPSLGPAAEFDRAGTLWLAANDEEQRAAIAKRDLYHAAGLDAVMLDAKGLAEAEPSLAPGLVGGLRVPGDSICYPPAVARELLERAEALGAHCITADVVAVMPGGVRCADGTTLSATHVVVAAGPESAALVPGLPVMPRRGHLVITERGPRLVQHQIIELGYLHSAHTLGGASVAFNVQPRTTGQLLVGSSRELVGFASGINRPLLATMLARAVARIPVLARLRVVRCWTGFRPATPDALPLIGPWPAIPGTWIATGHEGLGITLSPATADLVVAGILGEAPALDPAPYDPTRRMPAAEHAA